MIHIGLGTITLNGDKEEPGGEGGEAVGRRDSELMSWLLFFSQKKRVS